MSETRKPFPYDEFEPKWQARWDSEKTFRTPNPGEEGFINKAIKKARLFDGAVPFSTGTKAAPTPASTASSSTKRAANPSTATSKATAFAPTAPSSSVTPA